MTIARYYTESEARAVVIADGGDPSCQRRSDRHHGAPGHRGAADPGKSSRDTGLKEA